MPVRLGLSADAAARRPYQLPSHFHSPNGVKADSLGSARASRADCGALPQLFLKSLKFAMARRRHRQHARARALPGFDRLTGILSATTFRAPPPGRPV